MSSQANTPIPNRQSIIRTIHIGSENRSTGNGKLTKALPEPAIFTDRKDPFIKMWLSKMQGKFEINWDHYPIEKSQLIYVENKVKGKIWQHLEPYL